MTGAGGFAGQHLVHHLRSTTEWAIVPLTRELFDLRGELTSRFDDIVGDVTTVVHLAAAADVSKFLTSPGSLVRDNVDVTLNLLEWARTRELTHFIQVSTNEVYGPSGPTGSTAEWSPIAPATPYSASKAAQEALATAWWRSYGVPTVLTNTMHLFGEHQPAARFIPTAIAHLRRGEPVPVYTQDGRSASRCWTYVRDHADALRWMIERRPATPPRDGGLPSRWHISGREQSCVSVVRKIACILGCSVSVRPVPVDRARAGHELRYALNDRKLVGSGWRGWTNFDEALERTVKWWITEGGL